MRNATIIAAGFSAILTILAAAPAVAGYGALAHDDETQKYGLSSNEVTQLKADDVALKECGGGKCKIVFQTKPRECGAIATAESGNGWGAGKSPQRAVAELAALKNCQKRNKGQCKGRAAECNR